MAESAKKGITVKIDAELHAEVKRYLEENDMLSDIAHTGRHTFFVSDNTSKFSSICKTALKTEFPLNRVIRIAGLFAEDGGHFRLERIEQDQRHERLDRAGEAAAVDAPRAFAAQNLFAHGERQRERLLFRIL